MCIVRNQGAYRRALYVVALAALIPAGAAQAQQTGACCLPNGACQILTQSSCESQSGHFFGAFTTCTNRDCAGACCLGDGSCIETGAVGCQSAHGVFISLAATCSREACIGACCLPAGSCVQVTSSSCQSQGGGFQGAAITCGAADCAGACCLRDGSCVETGAGGCASLGGIFQGLAAACAATDCAGACCLSDGSCVNTGAGGCASQGGLFQGLAADCGTTDCAGACCLPNGSCIETREDTCLSSNGVFNGLAAACAASDCSGACCLPNGSCIETREDTCVSSNGIFNGIQATCAQAACRGACCQPDGSCIETREDTCVSSNGIFNGLQSGCAQTACRGACCLPDKGCVETGQRGCVGDYRGGATTCATACPTALSTAFTYQGQLKQGGIPVNGNVDLQFSLWISEVSGDQVGSTLFIDSLPVDDGLFTADLDFGANALNGNARWLEIAVCPPSHTSAPTCATLIPRQPLLPAPYALQTRGLFTNDAGNVGVGTKNPTNRLSVAGSADFSGNLGIGTNSPTSMIHLNRPLTETGIRFQTTRIDQGPPASLVRPPESAGTSGAGQPWTTPGNALSSDDHWAEVSLSAGPGTPDPSESQALDLTNLGFTLPAQAQVVGLSVQVEGHASCSCSDCNVCNVPLSAEFVNGAGPSQMKEIVLDPTDQTSSAGGPFDLWGVEWTAAQINSASLSVRLRATLDLLQVVSCHCFPFCFPGQICHASCDCTGNATVSVDAVSVTVFYYDVSVTLTPVDWTVGISQDDTNLRIAPTADLSFPALVVTPQGNVGIGTTDPQNFKLAVNGLAAKPNGGSWSQLSDRRLKKNVQPLTGALDRLVHLRGVTFEFTEEGLATGLALPGRQMGLIAQEVEEVLPEWVDETPSGHKFVTERGMTALTVEAVKEQQRQIDTLEAENADLKARLEAIEAALPKPPTPPDDR